MDMEATNIVPEDNSSAETNLSPAQSKEKVTVEKVELMLAQLTSMVNQLRNQGGTETSVEGVSLQNITPANRSSSSPTNTVPSGPESSHQGEDDVDVLPPEKADSSQASGGTPSAPNVATVPEPAQQEQSESEDDFELMKTPTSPENEEGIKSDRSRRKPPRTRQDDTQPKPDRLARSLCSAMKLSQRPLPKFSGGTYGEFWEFKRAFQRHIRTTGVLDDEKLETLISVYNGPAKEILTGYLQIEDPMEGYTEAWRTLDQRHGDKYVYINQLRDKVLTGPTVTGNDPKGLQQLSDDLECCVRNLSVLGERKEIDSYGAVTVIARRFKGNLWDDYTEKKHKYTSKREGKPPGIEWLVKFVRDRASKAITTSKEYGQRELGGKNANTNSSSRQSPTGRKHVGLITVENESSVSGDKDRCPLCRESHHLQKCHQFQEMTTARRVSVIREERRCFACLGRSHRMAECKERERCCIDGCSGYHSRLLHHTGPSGNVSRTQTEGVKIPQSGESKRIREVIQGGMEVQRKRPRLGHQKAIMPPSEPTYGSTSWTSKAGSSSRVEGATAGTQVFVTTHRGDPHRWVRQSPIITGSPKEPDSEES